MTPLENCVEHAKHVWSALTTETIAYGTVAIARLVRRCAVCGAVEVLG